MKKISILLPSLKGGGAERAMINLANGFVKNGNKVNLILISASGTYLNDISPLVKIFDLKKTRVLSGLFGLIRYLRVNKPDILLSAMAHVNAVALLAKIFSRTKAKIIVSDRSSTSVAAGYKQRFSSIILNYVNRYLYNYADIVNANSYGVANSTSKRLGIKYDQIKVIYNPVVTDKLIKMSEESVEYNWLPVDDKHLIVSAGRLTEAKDFSTLIRAFSRMYKCSNARLLILGEGELRKDLETLIFQLGLIDHVIMPGFIKNPFALIKKANLFVLSSAWEGLPNSLIEAMACGTPVVSTNCPSGPIEILENGKWGKLVPVGDDVLLAQAMKESLTKDFHPNVVKRAAYFSQERAVDSYLKLF